MNESKFLNRITKIGWKFNFNRWYNFSIVFYIAKVKPDGFYEKKILSIILTTKVYNHFFS